MIRHRDGGTRRSGASGFPDSVPEIARALRRVRTRQGLRLEDVSVRAGLALAQLEALESGSVDRMADRMATVKTLRSYANFLGLSGDQFALALVDCWPAGPGRPLDLPGAPTGPVALPPPVVAVHGTSGITPTTGAPTSLIPSVAPTAGAPTGPVTVVPVPTAATGPWSPVSQVPTVPPSHGVPDTGVTPRVVGRPHRPRRHRRGAPLWLKLLVGLVGLAVLVGVAGLVIQEVRPSWLRAIGLTHTPSGGTGGSGGARTTTTTTTHPEHSHTAGAFTVSSTTPTSATFDVRAPTFTVDVVAVGNDSWLQITEPGQASPLFAGILPADQSKSFSTQGTLVVEVGSSAAHLYISAAGKSLGFYFPPAAPYTMTFKAVS